MNALGYALSVVWALPLLVLAAAAAYRRDWPAARAYVVVVAAVAAVMWVAVTFNT